MKKNKQFFSKNDFSRVWFKRSEIMHDLIYKNLGNDVLTASEYGCGPYAPFYSSSPDNMSVFCFDQKKWDEKTICLNLNDIDSDTINDTDIAVLSGVIEYLYNFESLLEKLSLKHDYIVCSYAPFPEYRPTIRNLFSRKTKVDFVYKNISSRSRKNWVNHFDLKQFIDIVSNNAMILDVSLWEQHIILLCKFKKVK